jgi:hypothetical protein
MLFAVVAFAATTAVAQAPLPPVPVVAVTIKAWQARAQAAAQGFGSAGWRPGHVSIQTGDFVRPPPVPMRMAGAQAAAPIATEAGNSEIAVTVTGDAILEPARALR